MALWQPVHLRLQLALARRNGLAAKLERAALIHRLPVAYVLAVASRETGIRNILGDRGHGIGVMQIDIRYHDIAADAKAEGWWRHKPEPLIERGCVLLATNREWAQERWPELTERQHLKIAAAAYNAGQGGARRGADKGDADRYTTQANYGSDVLRRMDVFVGLLG